MVSTRSSARAKGAAAAAPETVDGVAEVKATRRGARSSAKAAAAPQEQQQQQQQEEDSAAQEVFKVRDALSVNARLVHSSGLPHTACCPRSSVPLQVATEVTPAKRGGSAASTPARATTSAPRSAAAAEEPLRDSPAGGSGPRVNRRLSMRELVQQVQDVPLPDDDDDSGLGKGPGAAKPTRDSPAKAASPARRAAVRPAPRKAVASRGKGGAGATASSLAAAALALLLATAAAAALAYAGLCTPGGRQRVAAAGAPLPPWLLQSAQPHCARAGTLLVQPLQRGAGAASAAALLRWRQATQQLSSATHATRAWLAAHYQAARAAAAAQAAQATSLASGYVDQARSWLLTQRARLASTPAGQRAEEALRRLWRAAGALLRAPRVLSPLSEVLPPSALAAVAVQPPPLQQQQQASGGGWVDAEDVLLHAQQGGVRGKATGLLLACSAGPHDDCGAALQRLAGGALLPEHLLVLRGDDADLVGGGGGEAEQAGRLQQRLARFLDASPAGVVLVAAPQALGARAWGVLGNALSEGGGLQLDGRAVPASRALFVVLLPLAPPPPPPHTADAPAEWFEGEAKQQLQRLVGGEGGGGGEAGQALALALRRRFEFVLVTPAVVDAAAEAANELAAAQAAQAQRLAEEQARAAEEAEAEAEAAARGDAAGDSEDTV